MSSKAKCTRKRFKPISIRGENEGEGQGEGKKILHITYIGTIQQSRRNTDDVFIQRGFGVDLAAADGAEAAVKGFGAYGLSIGLYRDSLVRLEPLRVCFWWGCVSE